MPKRKRSFRWVKWILFLILIVAAIVVVVLVKNNYFSDKKQDNPQQSESTSKTEDQKPEEKPSEDSKEGEDSKPEEKAPQYEGDSPNKSENLTGLITYADVINDELTIRVNIDQFLQSGNCNLTMSRNGVTYYSQSVGIQESVTTSTCDGYKIPVSELSKGDFQVEIDLESEGKSGKITGRVRI
ncbi:MAG: hypothetical protein Q4F58_00375 [Candidatus Saccharibacteria bacterium]|nr:hypothetical protein [Candidatus Saccharibacteria bacterium]